MKFAFIKRHEKEHCVGKMAELLGVTRNGYYSWKKRPESKRKQGNEIIKKEIIQIFEASKKRYGYPRVHKVLVSKNIKCGINKVAKFMKENDLRAKAKKKYKATTDSDHDNKVYENILDRNFNVNKPDTVWVSDITYVYTREGWLYLCVIIDLYSRKVVGYSTGEKIDTQLLLKAFMMAYTSRRPKRNMIFHSDRGVQYTSDLFQKKLKKYGFICSMSRKGNCWDNACAESFFHTIKVEELNHNNFRTREEAHRSIFEYIEIFYNRKRIHSYLGYLSPEEFELKAA
jgi:putative transposase